MKFSNILKDFDFKLHHFTKEKINILQGRIFTEEKPSDKIKFYTKCLIRQNPVLVNGEEVVRQLFLLYLIDDLGYPMNRIKVEYSIAFGTEKKRADIVIFDNVETTSPYIIVELKNKTLNKGKSQLKSYCNATGVPIGVWTNGDDISYYHRKDPNYFKPIPSIPNVSERLSDILKERWTIEDLINNDALIKERKSLKSLIVEMEDEVLANAGVDVFEEVFKLIFTKLYDEMGCGREAKKYLEFKNYGESESQLKEKMQDLFDKSKEEWSGVFTKDAKIMLTPSHLAICVSTLERVKLFNSNLEVVDEAFEYLINKSSKGEKGQYFTPRYVIDMCVHMLNPQKRETMIDTSSGSCGFPLHTILKVWGDIRRRYEHGHEKDILFTTKKKGGRYEDYVTKKIFAIDFDEKAVRVSRTLNLISGDGESNVLHLNTLDWERWEEKKDVDWQDIYFNGWRKLKNLRKKGNRTNQNRYFDFDILMGNPPFAGKIKETRIISKYDLGKNTKGKHKNEIGRDILFIERNLDFLKDGGRMALVLPQGRLMNSTNRYIRDYIVDKCRIIAVVSLHKNVFKPHTSTKTSVLFIQKWDEKLCPKIDDYKIFFASMEEPSKDKSGDKIYVKDRDGRDKLDKDGHKIVQHDLFQHEGREKPGILENFIQFAQSEQLSFSKLHIEDIQSKPNLPSINIKLLSESFLVNGRLDPEYYHPKYERLLGYIKNNEYKFLGELVNITKSIEPGSDNYSDEGIPFLRVKDMSDHQLYAPEIYLSDQYIHEISKKRKNIHNLKPTKGTILLSKDGSVCKSYLLRKDYNMITSSAILHLKVKDENLILPEYLYLILKSPLIKKQAERDIGGSILDHWSIENIKKVMIPRIELKTQKEIAEKFIDSGRLEDESKMLRKKAKEKIEFYLKDLNNGTCVDDVLKTV